MYLAARLGLHSSAYSREREIYIEPSDVHNEFVEWAIDTASDAHKRGQYVPTPNALLRRMRERAGLTMPEAAKAMGYSSKSSISNVENEEYDSVKRETLRRFRDAYADAGVDTTRLDQILREDVRFDEVVAVEETDRVEQTYDLEVQPGGEPIENFLGGRGGVFLSNTAGLCDPGYEGQITLELSNLGTAPVALTPEMRISQLTFTELKNPAERPYGAERGSKYQGQSGPQASRIQSDREFGGDQVDR
jgi:dCTP deaminase